MPARPRKTKRSDGRYVVKVTYTDAHGTKRRKACYGRTQAEATAKAQRVRERLRAGGPPADATCTLGEWLDRWRATWLASSDRAASTKALYGGLLLRWVVPSIGGVRLDRLRPSDVVAMLSTMEAAGSAASTRRNCYAALRGALSDAVAEGLLLANPVERVTRPKAQRHEARALTPAEAARFVTAAGHLRYADALRLILYTGLRRGEALGLRWEAVDLDRATAHVRGSLVRQNGSLRLSDTKTERSRRIVALSPQAAALLRAHKAAQGAERLRAGEQWAESGYVFTTPHGEPADPRNLLRAVQIAAKAAGLGAGIGVHTLRHTYATTALLHGVPLHVVSRNLGHSSVAITGDVYAHLSDEASRAAALAVSSAYGF